MLICALGGLASYILMYAAGVWWNSYWAYMAGQVMNGLFSGAYVLVMAFFLDMLSKEESGGPVSALMALSGLGAAVGSLVLMPFVQGRAENVFEATWIGVGGTVLAFVLIATLVSDSRKKPPAIIRPSSGEDENVTVTALPSRSAGHSSDSSVLVPRLVQRTLWVALIGSFLDAAGDEGTRIARGTILQNVWPTTNTIMFQNILLLSLVGLIIVVIGVTSELQKHIGYGACAVLGASATVVTQIMFLVNWETYPAFLAVWYSGKFFGFISTFASDFLIQEISPENAKGTWQGRSEMSSSIAEAIATLLISIIYDSQNDGSADGVRGKVALYITISISVFAVIAYSPLLRVAGKPKPKTKKRSFMNLADYEALPAERLGSLTLEEYYTLELERIEQGKQCRVVPWGKFVPDHPEVQALVDRAGQDLMYLKRETLRILTSEEQMVQLKKVYASMYSASQSPEFSYNEARKGMGEWLASYLDRAGYDEWAYQPNMFKAMIVNAFPPLKDLNEEEVPWEQLSLPELEDSLLNFLRVADAHIVARRSLSPLLANAGLSQALRKRR